MTGVLEDFSLFVFHPYGGKQRGTSLAALTDGERKDSLSVIVEFVKFHISRSRKINFKPETSTKMKGTGCSSSGSGSAGTDSSKAIIRFSSKLCSHYHFCGHYFSYVNKFMHLCFQQNGKILVNLYPSS